MTADTSVTAADTLHSWLRTLVTGRPWNTLDYDLRVRYAEQWLGPGSPDIAVFADIDAGDGPADRREMIDTLVRMWQRDYCGFMDNSPIAYASDPHGADLELVTIMSISQLKGQPSVGHHSIPVRCWSFLMRLTVEGWTIADPA